MSENTVRLDGRSLTIFDVVHAARDRYRVTLEDGAWEQVDRGRELVEDVLRQGAVAYGVNTGVGSQKTERISEQEIRAFNQRLIVAHATVASSTTLSERAVRAALVCLLNGFASGMSGIRGVVVRAMLEAVNADTVPEANAGASVGASDLVPLAQIALSVLGIAEPFRDSPSRSVPMSLEAKEALSLMNSNAVSLGQGSLALLGARKLLRGFDLSFAMALEGFRGNASILHRVVRQAHPQRGQELSTKHLERLLEDSALLSGEARNLQDPLSFRCAPQVNGAAYSALEWVWKNWEVELNSVQDNPVVARDEGRLISHGNMDSSLLTIGMDTLRSALANVVSISAQRLHKLHWPIFSGLPSGLTESPSALGGVQFLNLSHIGEAQAAAVRSHARPTMFVYQGQLADGVEDHATLLPLSVTETEALMDKAWVVQAIELTVACWAIRRRGIGQDKLGRGLREVYRRIDSELPVGREGTQLFDIRPIVAMVRDQELVDLLDEQAPPIPEFEPAPENSVVTD